MEGMKIEMWMWTGIGIILAQNEEIREENRERIGEGMNHGCRRPSKDTFSTIIHIGDTLILSDLKKL